ncbi:tetratricopeptide repeat-containing sulfotransferase family protein [Pararobbsia silviterrae]|uniref:Sulfotransferase family protein n=1 Tax=Pararobbsia silviterrae TaxID=1792498 RepID=A0A494XSQ4_9BURK|nr:tetratricopeptide repeat-containing sulfotransferase family protein [Pararobbsia silviterrae]RKP51906.1 sulfotransferase family protein [Pararobbsia silviterrae]
MSTPFPPQSMSVVEALQRAQAHWNAGQAAQAEQYCQRVLAALPGQADALHLLGLMAHRFGNLDLAIAYLREACIAPNAPAMYLSNLAEMLRQRGWLADAEEAGRRAVATDGTLVSAWNNLGIVLQEAGKYDASRECLERVVALQPDSHDAWNNLANTCRRMERFDLAESHYRRAIALNPSYAVAHSNLAYLLSTQGHAEAAAALARRAIELNPKFIDAYLNLVDVEISRRHYEAALRVLDELRAFAPEHPAALISCAKALRHVERNEEALTFARQAVALMPQSADGHCTLATVLQSLGHTEEALAEFAKAAQLPGAVAADALLGRATLLLEAGRKDEALAAFDHARQAFPDSAPILAGRAEAHLFHEGDPDFAALEAVLGEGERRGLPDRIAVHFALGKAYLDTKDSARAFVHLNEGNRLKRSTFAYDVAAAGEWMARVAEAFPAERFAQWQGLGVASDMPVFVLGMPRSGTTLIEQIVSSHPSVTGAGELSALAHVIEANGTFPDIVGQLTPERLAALGGEYLRRVTPLAKGRPHLVDKMPANFFYAGLIALMLPGARIIHTRRNAVDTCLSCYTKLFGGDQSFAYNLTELGTFYGHYERLMTHWRVVLPADRFIEVDYEAVVDDLEGEARRLIAFLGLPWDDACLKFHENQRVVRTASVNQVRQPIYRSAKGRWRAHADQLGDLLAALGMAP